MAILSAKQVNVAASARSAKVVVPMVPRAAAGPVARGVAARVAAAPAPVVAAKSSRRSSVVVRATAAPVAQVRTAEGLQVSPRAQHAAIFCVFKCYSEDQLRLMHSLS